MVHFSVTGNLYEHVLMTDAEVTTETFAIYSLEPWLAVCKGFTAFFFYFFRARQHIAPDAPQP
jgi:hypothetical protein